MGRTATMTGFEPIKVKGTFRLQIVDPDGKIAGDSGWHENVVANAGFREYLCYAIMGSAGSKYVGFAAMGSGGLINATDTTLLSEVGTRVAVSAASSNTSKAVRFTATFTAGWVSTTFNISNIGLVNSSSGGTLMCGNTFASSSCASNQAVRIWRLLAAMLTETLSKFGEYLTEMIPSQAALQLQGGRV